MKIEEEIRQSKFQDEYQKLVINLLFTSGWMNVQHLKFFRNYGISLQQFNVLRILRGQYPNPASVNLIMERMLDKTSNASRLVDKLELKKLVERKICKTDRRQVDVLITESGLELLRQIDTHYEEIIDTYRRISEKEAHQVNDILDKLRG